VLETALGTLDDEVAHAILQAMSETQRGGEVRGEVSTAIAHRFPELDVKI
jgi:chromosomal replication initiation ATPase DnaA